MRIVFLSNFLNHHQIPLADALWQKTNGEFRFVETVPMPRERMLLGYRQEERAYVIPLRDREALARQWIREADVVIAGSAPEVLIRERIKTGKLLFRYSERPLKKGLEPWKYLPRLIRWHWRNPRGKPIYLLCAGGYTAGDYAKFGLFQNRAFQWGYFPEARQYADIQKMTASKDAAEILWCGRFLDWKHPEDALQAAQRLKAEGYAFHLRMIGTGAMEEKLHQQAERLGLVDCVEFCGSMPPEQVRSYMERAGIFLFTSDRQEGWGAVLNEAMNSGCAVVASNAIGAVPVLLKDGENGMIYPSGDMDMLCTQLKDLLDHPEKQKWLGMAAYETIITVWNAETAAQRLLELAESILAGNQNLDLYAEGPCSPAEILRER